MRRQHAKVFITICFLILLVAAPATAQAIKLTEFQIPFSFIIDGRSLPAGTYTIERLDQSKSETLIMKNSAGRTMRIFFTQRVEAEDYKEVALLVFNRYGDEHIFSQIWGTGERSGRQLLDRSSKDYRSGKPVAVLVKGALAKSK
jgi:hypothetical protein